MSKFRFLLSILLLLLQVNYTYSQDNQTEQWILEQIKEGDYADLLKCPSGNKLNNEIINTIISTLALNEKQQSVIRIYNAVFTDNINIIDANPLSRLSFKRCVFNGEVWLTSSEIRSYIMFDHCKLTNLFFDHMKIQSIQIIYSSINELGMNNSNIEGNMDIENDTIKDSTFVVQSIFDGYVSIDETVLKHGIFFTNNTIKGDFLITNSKFYNHLKQISFQNMNIYGNMNLNNNKFESALNCINENVGSQIFISNDDFNEPIHFDNSQINRDLVIANSKFTSKASDISFASSIIKGNVSILNDEIFGNFLISSSFIGKNCFINNSNFHSTFDFSFSSILQDISVSQVIFYKRANLGAINIGNTLDFIKTKFLDSNENLMLAYSTFGKYLEFQNTTFNGGLTAFGVKVGYGVSADSMMFNNEKSEINFNSVIIDGNGLFFDHTKIKGRLDMGYLKTTEFVELHHCKINNADFHDMISGSKLKFDTVSFIGSLNLNNVTTGVLDLEAFSYPKTSSALKASKPKDDNIKLDGLTYKNLVIGKEGNEDSLGAFLTFLENASFNKGSYRLFETYLNDRDFNTLADQVHIIRKDKEGGFINWLTKIFLGTRKFPIWAFIWSIAFILLGWLIFWNPNKMEYKGKQDDSTNSKPKYRPLAYSFDLFFPFIKFLQTDRWEPKQDYKFLLVWMRVHQILGLVLISLGVAVFARLIEL